MYLAVFDWNGTLYDDTLATLTATNRCLAQCGRPPIDLPTLQETFVFPLIHFYEQMGVPVDHYLERAEELAGLFLKTYEQESLSHGLSEGAVDVLSWLRTRGVHIMILSNHLQQNLSQDVARLGVDVHVDYISGTHTYATITTGMNKRERLETYMQDNGFTPEKTFIIGDSHEEPEIARRLGIFGISISGGLLSAARLEKHKADDVVEKLVEIKPLLTRRWGIPL